MSEVVSDTGLMSIPSLEVVALKILNGYEH